MQEGAKTPRRRHQLVIAVTIVVLAVAVVLAITQLNLSQVWRSLTHAHPGWVVAALLLMGTSLFMRSVSWIQVLEAALPTIRIPRATVVRATMIGVMGSAVFPARVGEAARIVLVTRRLEGRDRTLLPVVAGTVFSQTLINLGALAILAVIALSGIPALHGKLGGLTGALIVPVVIACPDRHRPGAAAAGASLAQRAHRPCRNDGRVGARARPFGSDGLREPAPWPRSGRGAAGGVDASVARVLVAARRAFAAHLLRRRDRGRGPPGRQLERGAARDAGQRRCLSGRLHRGAGGGRDRRR